MSLFVFASLLPIVGAAAPPAVGEKAPDFTLSTPEGKHIRLSDVTSMGPVVLVVLRGYPGYQCPYCNRQVQDFMQNSKAFADAGARVVMIYPGPPQELGAKAKEFLADDERQHSVPEELQLLIIGLGDDSATGGALRLGLAGVGRVSESLLQKRAILKYVS